MKPTGPALTRAVAEHWVARRKAQRIRPGTKKHAELQLEFFIGAAAAAKAAGLEFNENVLWLLAVGRDVEDLLLKAPAPTTVDSAAAAK